MNSRELIYTPVREEGSTSVSKTTYKGQTIERFRGRDKYGPTNNTFWRWNGINFNRLKHLKDLIDTQITDQKK